MLRSIPSFKHCTDSNMVSSTIFCDKVIIKRLWYSSSRTYSHVKVYDWFWTIDIMKTIDRHKIHWRVSTTFKCTYLTLLYSKHHQKQASSILCWFKIRINYCKTVQFRKMKFSPNVDFEVVRELWISWHCCSICNIWIHSPRWVTL